MVLEPLSAGLIGEYRRDLLREHGQCEQAEEHLVRRTGWGWSGGGLGRGPGLGLGPGPEPGLGVGVDVSTARAAVYRLEEEQRHD